jgi:hypothetical protein
MLGVNKMDLSFFFDGRAFLFLGIALTFFYFVLGVDFQDDKTNKE